MLRNRLEQREASLEALKKNYEAQVCSVVRACVHVYCVYVYVACRCVRCLQLCVPGTIEAGLTPDGEDEILNCNFDPAQARRQDSEVQRLSVALSTAPREDVSRPGSKAALHRLASEVSERRPEALTASLQVDKSSTITAQA